MDILRYGRGSKTRYSWRVNLREAFFDENIENTRYRNLLVKLLTIDKKKYSLNFKRKFYGDR